MRSGRRRTRQRGSETVELALTLPLIVLLFIGIVELSLAYFDQAVLTNASRAAAREAIRALPPDGDLDNWNPVAEAQSAAQQAIGQQMFPRDISISVDAADVDPDPLSVDDGAQITVTLTYEYQFHLLPNFLNGLTDIDLTAVTRMRSLRPAP